MELPAGRFLAFFVDSFPSSTQLLLGGPSGLAWAALCLHAAGWLKVRLGWRTGYTRKLFHFSIFGTVALLQWVSGAPLVCLFGGMTSLVLLHALLRGPGYAGYEALAREQDAPRRGTYIAVPYLATFLGGVTANVLFGPAALAGYLLTGLGDAVGEPAGTRFGRHFYRVPSLGLVRSVRSLEGSAAVLLASTLAVALALALSPELALRPGASWLTVPLVALACTTVEAVSPHGWDNASLQIVASALAYWLYLG